MLTTEQLNYFRTCVSRAKKIIAGTVNDKLPAGDIRYHIRVSRRQMASGQWCLGLIFGTRKESEWMKVIDVTETEMRPMVTEYREILKEQIHNL